MYADLVGQLHHAWLVVVVVVVAGVPEAEGEGAVTAPLLFVTHFSDSDEYFWRQRSSCKMKRARDEESPLVVDTREWVKEQLAGMDGSHDFAHIERVWKLARQIGLASSPEIDMQVVELAALLHDIDDWKYSGSETAGIEKASAYLRSQKAPEALVLKVSRPPCCTALSLPSLTPILFHPLQVGNIFIILLL